MGNQILGLWGVVLFVLGFDFGKWGVESYDFDELFYNKTEEVSSMVFLESGYGYSAPKPLMVGLTLIQGAAAQGAGTLFLKFSCFIY